MRKYKPKPLANDVSFVNKETMEIDCTYNGCLPNFELTSTPTERLDPVHNQYLKDIKKGLCKPPEGDVFTFIQFEKYTMKCGKCGRELDTAYSNKLTGQSYNANRDIDMDERKSVSIDFFNLEQ